MPKTEAVMVTGYNQAYVEEYLTLRFLTTGAMFQFTASENHYVVYTDGCVSVLAPKQFNSLYDFVEVNESELFFREVNHQPKEL